MLSTKPAAGSPSLSRPFLEDGKKIHAYGSALEIFDSLENTNYLMISSIDYTETSTQIQNYKKPANVHDIIVAILAKLDGNTTESFKKNITLSLGIKQDYNLNLSIEFNAKDNSHDIKINKITETSPVLSKETSIMALCHIKTRQNHSALLINNNEILHLDKPRPKGLQAEVIKAFGKSAISNKAARLLLMATGSGKSFVISGITHAIGHGIYIVPNISLANEFEKDALKSLHGENVQVARSTQFGTLEEFKVALETIPHIIMLADDPLFAEKAALIKNKTVLIDEAHEHTYNDDSLATLSKLKDTANSNMVLALTGTPTSLLYKIFPEEPLADINLHKVIALGIVRQMHAKVDLSLEENLTETLLENYFGRCEYLQPGADNRYSGYKSPEEFKKEFMRKGESEKVAEENAINAAIKHNRERALDEKNFVFIDDDAMRVNVYKAYNDVYRNNFVNLPEIIVNIRNKFHASEVEERVNMYLSFHPEKDNDKDRQTIRENYEKTVSYNNAPITLADEIHRSQQKQINTAINAQALNILFPKIAVRDFESMQRTGTLMEFLDDMENRKKAALPVLEENIRNNLKTKFAPNLQKNQRDLLIDIITETVMRIAAELNNNRQNLAPFLHQSRNVDLKKLDAQYIVIAPRKNNKNQSEEIKQQCDQKAENILDQFRMGLVMHVISDERFSTGVSIPSVLAWQYLIYRSDDPLNNPVVASQSWARNLRKNDRCGIGDLLVNVDKVNIDLVLKPSDILAANSGEKMKSVYESRERDKIATESKREAVITQVKGKYEELDSSVRTSESRYKIFDRERKIARTKSTPALKTPGLTLSADEHK